MAGNTILTLGSPIKDNLAPSMVGPAAAAGTSVSGPATVAGTTVAGTGTSTATAAGVAKAASVGLFGSLFHTAAIVAAGYVGYRSAKALWGLAAKKAADA